MGAGVLSPEIAVDGYQCRRRCARTICVGTIVFCTDLEVTVRRLGQRIHFWTQALCDVLSNCSTNFRIRVLVGDKVGRVTDPYGGKARITKRL